MKNLKLILVGVFCLVSVMTMKAQDKPIDYFVGKWDVLVVGTPNGDAHSTLTLGRVDGKLAGDFKSASEATAIKLSKVEENADEVTVYFTSSSGYDVYLLLKKKDESHVVGTMMDMFDATGVRIVEEKK